MAREEKLPFIIHSRDAAKDTLDTMKRLHAGDIGGVVHCFSYGKEMAREYLDMGLSLGIGGVLTFKNARKLVEVVEYAPLESLLLETDSPYLAPVPNRGKRNSSLNIPYVVEKIAEIKGVIPGRGRRDHLEEQFPGLFKSEIKRITKADTEWLKSVSVSVFLLPSIRQKGPVDLFGFIGQLPDSVTDRNYHRLSVPFSSSFLFCRREMSEARPYTSIPAERSRVPDIFRLEVPGFW